MLASMNKEENVLSLATQKEIEEREKLLQILLNSDLPSKELINNLGLYTNRQLLSRILYMHEIYKKILEVHGVIIEFGVRWGQNMALFENLRGIYEPYNFNRKIIGFDTFEGFSSLNEKDGESKIMVEGAYSVPKAYEETLSEILDFHEKQSPIAHIKKYELVKGDATITAKKYFDENPHTIVAMAYFDFDIYQPTYDCLKIIKEHTTKGSVIAFDEINCKEFPGETLALKEVFGLDKYSIKRLPFSPLTSYIVID